LKTTDKKRYFFNDKSYYLKIPPFIFESAGIRKDDSTNQNDMLALKRKLDYCEKILLEKEIQLRIALDQIELLKKRTKKGIKGSKSDVRWRTVVNSEIQELWSMPEISIEILCDKFEHILHDKANILFERMDKEKG